MKREPKKDAIEIGKRIKRLRTGKKLTQQELADKLGKGSRTTVNSWEKGMSKPKTETILDIADLFGVTSDYIIKGNNEQLEDKFSSAVKNTIGIDLNLLEKSIKNEPNFRGIVKGFMGIDEDDVKIPLFSSISCGNLQSIDNILVDHVNVPKRLKNRFGEDLFSVRAKGDSMNNVILDGSIAVFSKSAEVKNGDVVAVLINGQEATMKRITKTNYAIVLEPDSSNPDHTPIFIDCVKEDCNDVQVLGKLVYSFNEFE